LIIILAINEEIKQLTKQNKMNKLSKKEITKK